MEISKHVFLPKRLENTFKQSPLCGKVGQIGRRSTKKK